MQLRSTEAQIHALSADLSQSAHLMSSTHASSFTDVSWTGLGFFASFAAPFGGFLSSAIKRAYGIKVRDGEDIS